MVGADDPRHEARQLFGMVERGAMTIAEVRGLIAIAPALRAQLEAWAHLYPQIARRRGPRSYRVAKADEWDQFSLIDLRFRDAVSVEFEKLVAAAERQARTPADGCGESDSPH